MATACRFSVELGNPLNARNLDMSQLALHEVQTKLVACSQAAEKIVRVRSILLAEK
jgi:hypothetical protein